MARQRKIRVQMKGNILRQRRLQLGIRLVEAAKAVGCSVSGLHSMELRDDPATSLWYASYKRFLYPPTKPITALEAVQVVAPELVLADLSAIAEQVRYEQAWIY